MPLARIHTSKITRFRSFRSSCFVLQTVYRFGVSMNAPRYQFYQCYIIISNMITRIISAPTTPAHSSAVPTAMRPWTTFWMTFSAREMKMIYSIALPTQGHITAGPRRRRRSAVWRMIQRTGHVREALICQLYQYMRICM